ncbi:MAG: hypothetical protein CTY16_01045 [Methylobacter sp.]|nr:MAG: hypothetical protein CTY16_01045 [Methylobacter sp.]
MSGLSCTGILDDLCASFWIKNALRSALVRDPIDALNDAELLVNILQENLVILQHPTGETSTFKNHI